MKKVKFGVIGYGQRGSGMTQRILLGMSDVEVIGVCDYYEDRTQQAMDDVEKACGKRPFGSTNYQDILKPQCSIHGKPHDYLYQYQEYYKLR